MRNLLARWRKQRKIDNLTKIASNWTGLTPEKIGTNSPIVSLSLGAAISQHVSNEADLIDWVAARDLVISEEEIKEVQATNPNALLDMLEDPVLCGLLVGTEYKGVGGREGWRIDSNVVEKALRAHKGIAAPLILGNPELAFAPSLRKATMAAQVIFELATEQPLLIYDYPDVWDADGSGKKGETVFYLALMNSPQARAKFAESPEFWHYPMGDEPAMLKIASEWPDLLWAVKDNTEAMDGGLYKGNPIRAELVHRTRSWVSATNYSDWPDGENETQDMTSLGVWLRKGHLTSGIVADEEPVMDETRDVKARLKYIALRKEELMGQDIFEEREPMIVSLAQSVASYKSLRQRADVAYTELQNSTKASTSVRIVRELSSLDSKIDKVWPDIIRRIRFVFAALPDNPSFSSLSEEVKQDLEAFQSIDIAETGETTKRIREISGMQHDLHIEVTGLKAPASLHQRQRVGTGKKESPEMDRLIQGRFAEMLAKHADLSGEDWKKKVNKKTW